VSKYGTQRGIQRYKCAGCGKNFQGGNRRVPLQIWEAYTKGKQTYTQLAQKYHCAAKIIQRKIDSVQLKATKEYESVANVLMDTTYIGRTFGVMVFKDSISNKYLYKQYIKTETNKGYLTGIEEIRRRGIYIQSIICDGRKGLFQLFGDIPVQMCSFHQLQIINRYLTKKAKTKAAIELRALSLTLIKVSKTTFLQSMEKWHSQWESYLKERTTNPANGKNYYTHKRLRSAWLSLKRNLPWLFTCEDYKELMMPHTANALDGSFADLKNKLRNHNGLSIVRKKKFVDGFFKA
jgi:hypothetical protein